MRRFEPTETMTLGERPPLSAFVIAVDFHADRLEDYEAFWREWSRRMRENA